MKFDLNFQRVIIAIALKIPLSWYKGGGDRNPPPPRSFRFVAVLRNDFIFSGKPFIFSKRHQQWLPSCPPSWISPRIRSQVKAEKW